MLMWVPVIGPWVCGVIAENMGARVLKQALAQFVTAVFFTLLILAVVLISKATDSTGLGSWIVDLVAVAFVIQVLASIVSAIQAAFEFSGTVFSMLTGITLSFLLQGLIIPLLGLLIAFGMLSAFRTYVTFTYGGGFFSWAWSLLSNAREYLV